MCLAIPGKLLEVTESDDPLFRCGRVSFEGIVKDIQLAYTPAARPGDYVLVHVGFSIAVVDETAAKRTLELLEDVDEKPALALAAGPEAHILHPRKRPR